MNVEENRLRTFRGKWPANAAVDPTRLAKAGFYYIGHDLEVQCFFCGTRISDWNYGDHVMVRHRTKAPKCPFVLAPTNTINIPFIPGIAENAAAESSTHQQSSADDHSQWSSSVENNSSLPQRSMDPLKEYGTLVERIVSFQKWPKTSIIHPHKLAMAGFYYLQNEDMVECAFCRGVIMNWKPGDNPDSVHRLNFPNCDFYMRLEPAEELFGFVCVVPESRTNMPGIQVHKTPQRPGFAMYEKRLQTFKGWPKNLKQTPEMLAEAGFYYSGYEDQVRCFHCDGGLRNWQPTDDVWVEHARWFSNCFFVNLVRGQDFVKYCVDNRNFDLSIITGMPEDNATESLVESVSTLQNSKPDDTISSATDIVETLGASVSTVSQPSESNTPVDATETMVASLSTVLQPNVSITNAEVEKLLETAPAMASKMIKLYIYRVKRALKNRMERVGISYTDVAQLIQDVLHHQVMEENNSLDNSTSNSPTSELNNLFNQVTIQMTNNSANKNDTQKSDVFERDLEKKKTDNELDDFMALQEENRKLKEARLCKVCMDHELAIVFLPCGHLATCSNCAPVFARCPLCRFRIHGYVRIFLS
ncbi:Apoptosis 2 inhibitor [Trachymyrmex septentrionalis]|uniref:Apoptosis 2 inhibitor n=1 Tax=Trachymyrmex septentrionalis TaxID=34720 RepID=A0A195ESM6_9HYME|nr:Apoptosis 2 inhibitor [Trachymyrmex septentrionalis]